MTRVALIFCLCLTTFCARAQDSLIRDIAEGDTLVIQMEKISSRFGLDSETVFYATKTVTDYKIKLAEREAWKTINSDQWNNLKKFEKSGIKKGCDSSNYVIVKVNLREKEEKFNKCWEEVDILMNTLEMLR